MQVMYPGHRYKLDHLDGSDTTILQFVQRAPHHKPQEGVTSQEVLRALIDRVRTLNMEVLWDGNFEIIKHLQTALALFETRAILRKVKKGELAIEDVKIDPRDGHIALEVTADG